MLIYMFSLSLVFSFPICLCSVAGSSVSRGDSAGAGALERALDIRAFSAIKHLLERTVAALGWCDGMFWSLHVHRHQARLQRAAGMPVMVPAGEEDGPDPQGAASALCGTRGQGLLSARAANPCPSHSTLLQLSSDFPQPSTEIGGKSTTGEADGNVPPHCFLVLLDVSGSGINSMFPLPSSIFQLVPLKQQLFVTSLQIYCSGIWEVLPLPQPTPLLWGGEKEKWGINRAVTLHQVADGAACAAQRSCSPRGGSQGCDQGQDTQELKETIASVYK